MLDSRKTSQQLLTKKAHVPQPASTPWREVRLGDVAKIIVSNVDKKTKEGEQPVRLCNYTDVYKRDTIDPRQDFMAATATLAEIEKYALKIGDVIITKDSEVADDIAVPAYVAETSGDLVCGYHLAIIRSSHSLNGRFMKYYFEFPRTRYYFGSRSSGVTRFGLTIEGIKEALIRLPSEREQCKIAEILGSCDEVIEAQERLIAQKQECKKGLMQRLLTGKIRFPQFAGKPWKEVRLGDICSINKGVQKNRIDLEKSGTYPVINGGITPSGYCEEWNTDAGTITISEGGSCGFVQIVPVKFWCGGHCYALGNLKAEKGFLLQMLKCNEHRMTRLKVGSALPNIQKGDLLRMVVRVPESTEEQAAISAILSAQDEEIDLQQQKIEQLKQQKKGLMQRLLTGKVRVKV